MAFTTCVELLQHLVLRYWAVADMASFGVFGSCDGHVPMNLFNKMSILKASFLVAQHVGHKWSQLEFIPSLHLGGLEKRMSGGWFAFLSCMSKSTWRQFSVDTWLECKCHTFLNVSLLFIFPLCCCLWSSSPNLFFDFLRIWLPDTPQRSGIVTDPGPWTL